jgi:hypothetical protein
MNNPDSCKHCGHKQNSDGGWCYLFRTEPTGWCTPHTISVAAEVASRRQQAQRMIDA